MNQGNNNIFAGLYDIIEGDAGFDEILQHKGSGARRAVLGRYNYHFSNLNHPLPDLRINQHPRNTLRIAAGIYLLERDGPQLPPNPSPPVLHNPGPPQAPPPPQPGPAPNPLPHPTPGPSATIFQLPKVNGKVALEGTYQGIGLGAAL